MIKQNEFKETGESVLTIRKVVGDPFKDEKGNDMINTQWEQAEVPISIGSLSKPNQHIIHIKYRTPSKNPMGFLGLGG